MAFCVTQSGATVCELLQRLIYQNKADYQLSGIRIEYANSLNTEFTREFTKNPPTEPSESTSSLLTSELRCYEIYTMLSILSNSKMGRSNRSKTRNADFIYTWLESHSRIKASGVSNLLNHEDSSAEARHHVAGERSTRDIGPWLIMTGKNFDRQAFDIENFKGHFVVNVTLPLSVSSMMNSNSDESLPECSKRRYTAITVDSDHFSKQSGFLLRQTILQRNIDRLVAVKVDEEIGSEKLIEKMARVTKDVRNLIRHCEDPEAWQYIVIGIFCQYKEKKVVSELPRDDSILYKLGILAEFPVEVNYDKKNVHMSFGLNQPTSVRFTKDMHSGSAPQERFVTAHLHEVSFLVNTLFGRD
jgi:hypothetical protein